LVVLCMITLFLSSVFLDSSFPEFLAAAGADPQTKKEKSDYLTTVLLRNTEPLGLKENPVLKKYLSQPPIKWAVRSAERHILN